MDRLVDDLLTLARSGQQPDEIESVELARIVHEAWRNVDVADAELVVHGDLGSMQGHAGRLLQLFENLFRNSVEHGSTSSRTRSDDAIEHGGPDVTVEVGLLDGLGFYVADDGPGIPPAERESVFEYGSTTKTEGTGFGLSIVADIAKVHGWTVEVTESATGGARFEFWKQ